MTSSGDRFRKASRCRSARCCRRTNGPLTRCSSATWTRSRNWSPWASICRVSMARCSGPTSRSRSWSVGGCTNVFAGPASQVLLLSCGVIASPGPDRQTTLGIPNPFARGGSRADALLFVESLGKASQALITGSTTPLGSEARPTRGPLLNRARHGRRRVAAGRLDFPARGLYNGRLWDARAWYRTVLWRIPHRAPHRVE